MSFESTLPYLGSAMSLRPPQKNSLQHFAEYIQQQSISEYLLHRRERTAADLDELTRLSIEYFQNQGISKGFSGFERSFPSYTFALATGVGKTRLMGAFIAYLHLVHRIKHFLVVAPGNTIYRKLVDDFGKANNPKYVFKGVEEININTARIITRDNYQQSQATQAMFGNQLQINIFNIQQFAQSDEEGGKGITKYNENLGESYFDYLASLPDLVVLLDESHHYHADAAMLSLGRINPMFALEFTATPYTGEYVGKGKSKSPVSRRNILLSYQLGDAIKDGFVKDPWIGTEADVDFSQWDPESIEADARKLQLAAYFHERAKIALKEYAASNSVREVKPVMLVVAKDTAHASSLRSLMDSDQFRAGAFKGRIIEVHTKTRGDEADETIEKLLSLEHPDNIVEVVIHVNMLKEGWDVTNIYTIAPVRSSASDILTEQTIGRGLRLPYGRRTGNKNVDRVMIVAHDNYSKIIEIAKTSSLIQPTNVEAVSASDLQQARQVIEVQPVAIQEMEAKLRAAPNVMEEIKQQAKQQLAGIISESTPEQIRQATIETKAASILREVAKEGVASKPFISSKSTLDQESRTFSLFSTAAQRELGDIVREAQESSEKRHIPIPRLMLTPHFGNLIIPDFDLDLSKLTRHPSSTSIIEQRLQSSQERDLFGNSYDAGRETEVTRVPSLGGGRKQSPENTIIASVVDHPLVDYEEQQQLLRKLARQAADFYRTYVADAEALSLLVENNFRQIASEIYAQIVLHKRYLEDDYIESSVRESKPFLEAHRHSISFGETIVSLDSQVDTFSRDKLYGKFKKACHSSYRFDSSDEARFAYLLEKDRLAIDWLRPAPSQFEGLFWRDETGNAQRRYEPDFVVELEDEVVMVEVKPRSDVGNEDVLEKTRTAQRYCSTITNNLGNFGITKPWRYKIVLTEQISITSTLLNLLKR